MKKKVEFDDNFYEIEASRWLKQASAKMSRISFTECKTKSGTQFRANLHARLNGEDEILTAPVWPRDLGTDKDIETLRSARVQDLMLRFGKKVVKTVDEESGEEVESIEYGQPKWTAYFDGSDWIALNGGKVPFSGDLADTDDLDDPDGESDEA